MEVGKAQIWLSASKTCDFFQLTENSTGLLCLSANYIAGKMMLARAMVSGMNLICVEPSGNPVKELKIPIDFAAMVPLQVEQSLSQITNLNLIKNLIVGGGQVSNSLTSKLKTYAGKAFETFGMTETLSHIALRQLTPEYQNYFTSFNGVFILQGFNNVMVIDFPELGIYKLKTNDIIEIIDTSCRFVWKGRTDFIINSGGIKISPEELESKIAHLIPQRFCICGVPDSKLGETIVLFIEGKPYQTDTLKQKIKEILPSYSCPKKIQFLATFPLTETGKIKRKELITLLQ
jgi:O-succinylbenzoic acid--CoA ligase